LRLLPLFQLLASQNLHHQVVLQLNQQVVEDLQVHKLKKLQKLKVKTFQALQALVQEEGLLMLMF